MLICLLPCATIWARTTSRPRAHVAVQHPALDGSRGWVGLSRCARALVVSLGGCRRAAAVAGQSRRLRRWQAVARAGSALGAPPAGRVWTPHDCPHSASTPLSTPPRCPHPPGVHTSCRSVGLAVGASVGMRCYRSAGAFGPAAGDGRLGVVTSQRRATPEPEPCARHPMCLPRSTSRRRVRPTTPSLARLRTPCSACAHLARCAYPHVVCAPQDAPTRGCAPCFAAHTPRAHPAARGGSWRTARP